MNKKVRVRYAPSPTGYLHIGNARTAIFNYLFAKASGGELIVRIDDTDSNRNVSDGVQSQLKWLSWLGIEWTNIDNLYYQSKRLHMYIACADYLVRKGLAYVSDTGSIRFKTTKKVYSWIDLVKGPISIDMSDSPDITLIRDNGVATYNFATVVDDSLLGISHVLRGDDHISNTPKQLMLYEALGFLPPSFGHMPLILGPDRKKLSKRDGGAMQFISQYAEQGYLPEAVLNYISLLGWSPKGNEEIFSKEGLISAFDPSRLLTAPAIFDPVKLRSINAAHIKMLDIDSFYELSKEWIDFKTPNLKPILSLIQNKVSTLAEIPSLINGLISPTLNKDSIQTLETKDSLNALTVFRSLVSSAHSLDKDYISIMLKELSKRTGLKGFSLFSPIRIVLTTETKGPDLVSIIEILGKKTVLNRIDSFLMRDYSESD